MDTTPKLTCYQLRRTSNLQLKRCDAKSALYKGRSSLQFPIIRRQPFHPLVQGIVANHEELGKLTNYSFNLVKVITDYERIKALNLKSYRLYYLFRLLWCLSPWRPPF